PAAYRADAAALGISNRWRKAGLALSLASKLAHQTATDKLSAGHREPCYLTASPLPQRARRYRRRTRLQAVFDSARCVRTT
ncbi:MAG: hypothetical protein N2483_00325, partial [Burkholderiaceae bacterium]|nr:hypothetical protein [Burkholderiaceae bacterium]